MTASKKALEKNFLKAVKDFDWEAANACFAANVDVDLKDNRGRTALMFAARYGYIK